MLSLSGLRSTDALHHMRKRPLSQKAEANPWTDTPLIVTNRCPETIWPGISTQSGYGPPLNGFELKSGSSQNQTVSADWQGRIWGRTNCTFNNGNGGGKACGSGDCNGVLDCRVGGDTPVTLAEFTLNAGDGQTYYDISLVDGYNLPLAIVLQPLGNRSMEEIPPNLTNPSCMATGELLAEKNFSPYDSGQQFFLGTTSANPLPFENSVSVNDVIRWCPWDLQVKPPTAPGDGVYPYPDDIMWRPSFNPCYSACAKWNKQEDCCTGSYGSPSTCQPSEYSRAAKRVCPDAYSYAFDDQTSTFIIPAGSGFEVVFCPGGRSTNILASEADQLNQLANTGHVSGSNSK
ncbi:hypothetical protein W97_01356 [Coniosporium apollinis CBS 100218]|uniref:Thaumatin family protein n=1 Tax=Coniosporium apollinis (strain CBS 100218) TaxID=1168221 RepID=R7YJP6_CONA1|nr:uncharacterized protein W97_01356 [Coniosporium apollinis CBS 100218]EON62137.1 hypothetical protein W97_01356 [Coniosporium apollinis CBS 100218]